MNLNFVKSLGEISVGQSDSILIVGKSKDLKHVEACHLGTVLNDLDIPESVRSGCKILKSLLLIKTCFSTQVVERIDWLFVS